MTYYQRGLGTLTGLAVSLMAACGERVDKEAARVAIESAIQNAGGGNTARSLKAWYAANDYEFSWTRDRSFDAAKAVFREAASHGLKPEWYDTPTVEAAYRSLRDFKGGDQKRVAQMAAVDVQVTAGLLAVGHDVSVGRTAPSAVMEASTRERRAPDVVSTLARALDRGGMGGWLDAIAPKHPEYQQLRGWLAGLRQSGDPRAGQIAANLERWRWVADDLGDRHIIVNIPEFMLRAREHHTTVLEMPVVVGRPDGHETPMLSGELTGVVFNPYWNVPESVLLAETIPAMAKDRDYLERHDMEVVRVSSKGGARTSAKPIEQKDVDWDNPEEVKRVRIRQRPGGDNALGKIKFPFNNDHLIYLHDTPATALFSHDVRAFSHGCVRVAEPDVLAGYVLAGDGQWTPDRIGQAISGATEMYAKTPAPLPVHLVYFTVIAGPDGSPVYRKDVYGLDRKQTRLWDERAPSALVK